ncbi:MAG: PolC-type DNA polymerase III [Lachnospiraceae bacterium]|nr:PolC-type DNA polymerase III [Lachnospiraceae bacterium]
MEKLFFEAFKSLKLKKNLSDLFEDVTVSKISATNRKDLVKIYIRSTHLIPKRDIYAVEAEIKKQIFAGTVIEVHIIEEYHLSESYTPKTLIDEYLDSMYAELTECNRVMENALKKVEFKEVNATTLEVSLPDLEIIRAREHEILEYLSKVVNERCNLNASFVVSFHDSPVSSHEEWDEYRISQLVKERLGAKLEASVSTEELPSGEASNAVSANSGKDSKAEKTEGAKEPAGSKPAEKTAGKADGKKSVEGKKSFGEFGKRKSFAPRGGNFEKSDNPDVIWGREISEEEEITPIEDIVGEVGYVVIRGKVIANDRRDIKNEKSILFANITDFTDTIRIKMFVKTEDADEILNKLSPGNFVKVWGMPAYDSFDKEICISSPTGIMVSKDFRTKRMDTAPVKRVELHCHTKMSDMDGVSEVSDIVSRAFSWGHKAIAITDHGVVQAFPDANHTWEKFWKKEKAKKEEAGETADKQNFFKVIYGVEGYLVDDLSQTVTDSKDQSIDDSYVVFDIETTGFSPTKNKIIEIGAVKVEKGAITGSFSEFVNPEVPIPYRITKLTSITDDEVKGAPTIETILPKFLEFCEGSILVAHNASFDTSFIKANCERLGLPYDYTVVDTVGLSRALLPKLSRYKLDVVAKELNVSLENHHRAVDDATCTGEIFVKLLKRCRDQGLDTLDKINDFARVSPETVKKLPSYHVILLAKNNTGRVNLYTLISKSHLDYFARHPRIPKSEIMKHREGLIIGSACEAGELYRAIVDERSEETIGRIVDFYDYLEIQPRGNNAFMIRDEKHENINSEEDILEINREIVRLGEQYNKPVCATCDVHFLDPEDEIYRRIIMKGQGFEDADQQAPLYLHTTDEMLEEFGYLGRDKAMEVVVTNTNKIADMIESMSPVRPDKCPPVIENSDGLLTEICYNKAHEMYGPDLPEIVKERLERELHSIITNGFAVMYIIAQKLVWKSVEDGYLVGSRGSVGSSFVATMAGITEVNPLVPHYYCSKCHFYDFDSDEVKAYRGKAGVDMPDRMCPVCGEKLNKDGFDIPFETFLGFKGDKEPDIDLNFSGEYQSKAHKYTEVIFGAGQTFRAGTIGTLADKTAFGYVKKYFEEKGIPKRNCEIDRIVQGCVGVRRSTGQHPGGIIVLPVGEDINSFTPVQHPANDTTTDIVTTHFDYHSIDHNLLKLDILGHDDPTMIRMLQDLTGMDPLTIPLDDPKVMSLFESTEALGVTPADIGGCELGCLGIPEFGTDFSMGMVQEAKPTCFSDLIRIAGLSHGTDVWLNNAQDLIRDGIATISTAICTRDDIMTYLIGKGVESEKSFKIMEMVRKGKVAAGACDKWPEWKEDMLAHDVPDWYIDSCEKIKYMFPRAHAAAYVMMAWRIAYCKVYYPAAYYAAFFSIRAKAFNYETMCFGRDRLEEELKRVQNLENPTPKESDSVRDLRIVQEMYARGLDFVPIDLFTAKSRLFSVVDDKHIMPSFSSIEGLGETAADSIVEAAKGGPFLSRDDFKSRAKVSQTSTDTLARLGILGDIPLSNQISIFDFM